MKALPLVELQAKSHQRSNGRAAHLHGQEDDGPSKGKRYLILAYRAEFDQIQYPLPLCLEENPTPEFFRSIHRRLHADKEAACQVRTQNLALHDWQIPRKCSWVSLMLRILPLPALSEFVAACNTARLTGDAMQRAAGKPIVSAGGAVLSEDDVRLERLVARLREPLQSGLPAQPSNGQRACSADQVSFSSLLGAVGVNSALHLCWAFLHRVWSQSGFYSLT